MLVANPHLPWSHLFTWYEQHLVGPDVDVSGVTLVGLPGIAIGFNERLGWTHTVNTYDGFDLFVLDLEGEGYRFDGEVRPFETRPDTVRIREDDGSIRGEVFTVRSSVHGPLVAGEGDRAVVLRVAGVERGGSVGQWWDMARSRTLEEFEAALRQQQIPMFNVVYADADGRIFYLFNGLVPDPAAGLPASVMAPADGSDPSALWTGYLPYEGLPRLVDPGPGWIQNANDPPWTATLPTLLDPGDFAPNLAPVSMGARPQRSANILRSDESVTFEELVAYKHDTRAEMADRVLDELVPLAEGAEDPAVREAGRVLAEWDRTVDADSRGAVLFERWLREWSRDPARWATPWSFETPASTPAGIGDAEAALAILARAAAEVQGEFGALDVAWGEVHRARRNGRDVPVSGGPGAPMGIFRVAEFVPGGEGVRQVVAGDSWYAVLEFTPEGVRGRTLLAYGNATQPGSPHFGDQLDLFARQEMRPVWRTRAEVEANLDRVTELPPGG
jgi:acyl-homoserine-lactone acylase